MKKRARVVPVSDTEHFLNVRAKPDFFASIWSTPDGGVSSVTARGADAQTLRTAIEADLERRFEEVGSQATVQTLRLVDRERS